MARNVESTSTDAPPDADPLTGEIVRSDHDPLPAGSEYGVDYRVSDVIPTPDRWAMYDQIDRESIVGMDVVILDFMVFESLKWADRDWVIILLQRLGDTEPVTTACGGAVVVRKLNDLRNFTFPNGRQGAFPIAGRLVRRPSRVKGQSDYYDLI